MRVIALPRLGTVAAWRDAARGLAAQGVPAEAVSWSVGPTDPGLFDGPGKPTIGRAHPLHLTREALSGIETALLHRDPQRFTRAYDIILRLGRGDLRWGDRSDPALHRLLGQKKAVERDIHKMHAFVRFRDVTTPSSPRRAFVAWFEPDHCITEAASTFFARRFGDMDWVIATPDVTARFVAGDLTHEITTDVSPPPPDATDTLWRTYYANIFNPARLMISAMTSEMPRKYWKNLPEADLIPGLIRTAQARAQAMQAAHPSIPPAHLARIIAAPMPEAPQDGLAGLKRDVDACRRCPIGACATQGVVGEGPVDAALMIVGEQPGDQEDLTGRPFVGPAGQMFDTCAAQAGLSRQAAYVTNAVKHFKFRPQGKRRIHMRPTAGEVTACRWWLEMERTLLKPRLIVALGATAALALTGNGQDILSRRGNIEHLPDGTPVLITLHPAHILRSSGATERADALAALTTDLGAASRMLDKG